MTVPFSEFVFRSRLKYGNRFVYDEESYTTIYKTINVTCVEHNYTFKANAFEHCRIRKWSNKVNVSHNHNGCPECVKKYRSKSKNKSKNPRPIKTYKCNRTSFVDVASFLDFLKVKYNGTKVLISKATNITYATELKFMCLVDNCIFYSTPKQIMRKNCCKCCENLIKLDNIKNTYIKKHGDKYNYDDVVVYNTKIKLKIYCKTHKEYFYQTHRDHMNGNGCPKCGLEYISKYFTKSLDDFYKDAKHKYGDDYTYTIDSYINRSSVVNIKCNSCGTEFQTTIKSHLQSKVCDCKHVSSHGEKKILDWLCDNNIKYVPQYRDVTCKYITTLSFDFAIFYEDVLLGLVEYQGRQHYEKVKFGNMSIENMEREFNLTKIRDKIKLDWCEQNNIPLLLIEYTNFKHIPELLQTFVIDISKQVAIDENFKKS